MSRNPADIKVFVTRDIPSIGIELLKKKGFQVTMWPHDRPMTATEMIHEARQAHALISLSTDTLDQELLRACSHLDIISQFAAGYDNIDIPVATELRILIGNAPTAMSDATADIAFGLMIAVSRKFFFMHKSILKGEWSFFRPKAYLGIELKNKTLGIFGLGNIGTEMAKRCKGAYNMNILYCNRRSNLEAERLLGARKVDFEVLLSESDVISVHCSLNDATRGVFNKSAFERMKPTSLFINTSRGPVHDEKELINALNAGKILGAGLDVTNPEPMDPANPLLTMENVAILPHIGSATIEARSEMSRQAAVNIIDFYEKGVIPHPVNTGVIVK